MKKIVLFLLVFSTFIVVSVKAQISDKGADATKNAGSPMTGDYIVGDETFNLVTGLHLEWAVKTRHVLKEFLIQQENISKENALQENVPADKNSIHKTKKPVIGEAKEKVLSVMREVEELYYVPMLNGKEYTGSLYHAFTPEEKIRLNLRSPEMTPGVYATITAAIDDVNLRGIGASDCRLILDDISYNSESFPITITSAAQLPTANSKLIIIPNSGTAATIIGSSNVTALFNLDGVKYVTFDGLNSGGSSLFLRNTTGAVFRFVNGGSNNTITNCTLEANMTNSLRGVVWFTTSSGATGNNSNTISNNTIRDRSDASGTPANLIYSGGTAGKLNASNTISGNNLFNFTANGILISSTNNGDNWIITGNSIYQTAGRTTALWGISVQGGSGHTISSNYIGGTAINAGSSNLSTNSTFRGIDLKVGTSSATSVQGNIIKNIRSSVTGYTASYGIYVQAGLVNVGNISGNTVGSSNVAERFQINGDSYGIYLTSTTNCNISNNTVQNMKTISPSTGEYYFGIVIAGTGSHTIIGNTIDNLVNTSAPDATYNSETTCLLVTATGIQTIRGNTISNCGNLNSSVPTAKNNFVWGIEISGPAATSLIEKNKIYNLYGSSSATGARSDQIQGITMDPGTPSAIVSNNMISLFDGSASDRFYFGIVDISTSSQAYYYNTVVISGTASNANNTYAFNRNTASSITLKNNLFANYRSGGTGKHYAIANVAGTPATGWSSTSSNYNMLISSSASNIGEWGSGTSRTFAQWQSSSLGDANSFSNTSASITRANLFLNADAGDLHIITSNSAVWNIKGNGTQLSINTDFDGDSRSTTVAGGSTCIGADEFGTPSATPPNAVITGSISDGSTSTISISGRNIAAIDWHTGSGVLPASIVVNYFSGIYAPNTGGGPTIHRSNCYWEITATGGTAGYNYDITLNYDPASLGDITNQTKIKIAKAESDNVWTNFGGTVNTGTQTVQITGLSDFSKFTLTDSDAPLPVELGSFTSFAEQRNVELKWSTSTEQNNTGFDIERKVSGAPSWSKVGNVTGHGTSSVTNSYSFKERNLPTATYNYRLKQIDNNGNFHYYELSNEVIIGVPAGFSISQNYPNPFNPATKINYDLPFDSKVSIVLIDLTGRQVAEILNTTQQAGYQTVSFNASNLSSGTYFYQINANGGNQSFSKTLKMMLVK
ncbi:hypothetical protein BH10BAC5_BH10BAC5_20140 [soil metagenome]